MAERFDVFISYAHRDRPEWVETLAGNLHRSGFEVFLDAWEIGAGDVLVHELDRGILESRHGVLVLTRSYFERPFVRAEYAAIMQRTIQGDQRVIPVLVDDVEIPPLLAARVWIDFRGADGPKYEQRLAELTRALRGEKGTKDRPARTSEVASPPATRYRPEGTIRRTLRIADGRVALLGGEEEVSHEPGEVDLALGNRLHELAQARKRRVLVDGIAEKRADGAGTVAAEASLHQASLAAGAALAQCFLSGEAGTALREAVRSAETAGSSLELALQVAEDGLRNLPWETLRIPGEDGTPGEPLTLHPRVYLFRSVTAGGPVPAVAIPGPLRILVAIGSPESGGGELLDYETELGSILDAVEPARDQGKAHVRILHRGTVRAIREALDTERYHVLHLSCHAAPGKLILEDDEGEVDEVTADRLWSEALPADQGVPLVVLAGCATALDVRQTRSHEEPAEGEQVLPGLAAELLDHGVPTVLAMQASVSDRYATALAARLYRSLATHAEPAPLPALAQARREIELGRRKLAPEAPGFQLAEWATPALYLRGVPQNLYDPSAPFEKIEDAPAARFAPGVVVRKVGEFVGRRREERLILKALRDDRTAGVLIRGIGGVGKSTLAAEVLSRLVADGRLVVSVVGETAPESVLEEIGKELLTAAQAAGLPEDHALRQIALAVRRPDTEWPERFDLLAKTVLGQHPLVLLLDNFEDNLSAPDEEGRRTVRNQALASFLARWLEVSGKSHVLVTCRYPFALPDEADRYLRSHHLGPLSFAETRKLFWRLPALGALSLEERIRAYRAVGGHPRALEYLDTLLHDGEALYKDVEIRLVKALKKQGIHDPDTWIRSLVGSDLDKALAETATLAAADVLLHDLLALLDSIPLARRLLLGASVYRVPVDETALAWQVAEEREREPDPEWKEIQGRVAEATREVRERGETPTRENLGLSQTEWDTYDRALQRALTPPLDPVNGLPRAIHHLERLGLLSPEQRGDTTFHQVHRWTATLLAEEADLETLQDAHRRAASFWRWRVDVMPQSRQQDVDQLFEARHHHHAAGDLAQAVETTGWVCSQLETWGAYGREEQLCHEVLEWVPERSREAAAFLHQLGIVAQERGSYEEALDWYRKSLSIKEELGDRSGMASSYHQLGRVAQERGSYEEALDWYRKSLSIEEELGNRSGMASSYHQLGRVAQERGSYEEALDWYRKSLSIMEELGNRSGMASSYHQLGVVAQGRGSYEEALDWYRKSLSIEEELGNRSGMASSYHQLGRVAQGRGSYEEALDWYRKSLSIEEELGNRSGMASSYHQLGMVAEERGSYEEALDWYRKSLSIMEELGNRSGMAISYHQLGMVAQKRGSYEEALDWYRKSLSIQEELGNRSGMASSYHQLGMVAQLRGSYEEALDWYRKSLSIMEELGDRSGMASSYHQLGTVAQKRGSYEEALDWYRKSLSIMEELGNRSGMASSISQIGVLLTETGKPEEGVPRNLQSLAIRLEIGVPQVATDLFWLGRQREALGEERFEAVVRENVGEGSAAAVIRMVNEFERLRAEQEASSEEAT